MRAGSIGGVWKKNVAGKWIRRLVCIADIQTGFVIERFIHPRHVLVPVVPAAVRLAQILDHARQVRRWRHEFQYLLRMSVETLRPEAVVNDAIAVYALAKLD